MIEDMFFISDFEILVYTLVFGIGFLLYMMWNER
jgi:hypothetical protein